LAASVADKESGKKEKRWGKKAEKSMNYSGKFGDYGKFRT